MKSIAVGNLIVVMFWTMIEFAICFEWEVITALVKFQSTCSLSDMGVKKQYFNEKHEGFILRWHIVMNILNLLFNTLVILVVLSKTSIEEVQLAVRVAVDIWSVFLLIYLALTLYRLIYYARKKSIYAFQTHQWAFYMRAAVLLLSIT